MARNYHVEIAAFVANADQKWIDNLLSRAEIPGVESAKQGVARRISVDGVRHIALVRRLTLDLSIATDSGVALARQLLGANVDVTPLSEILSLQFNRARFHREIEQRLAHAVESIVPARRGRPPTRSAD